jgi:hypothetical protein
MQTLLTSIVAAVAGLTGTLLGSYIQRRTVKEVHAETRSTQRRQELVAAIDVFTEAVGSLVDVEYDQLRNASNTLPRFPARKCASKATGCAHRRGPRTTN